ncbi:unnamed protein product [Ixodes pacificus]
MTAHKLRNHFPAETKTRGRRGPATLADAPFWSSDHRPSRYFQPTTENNRRHIRTGTAHTHSHSQQNFADNTAGALLAKKYIAAHFTVLSRTKQASMHHFFVLKRGQLV